MIKFFKKFKDKLLIALACCFIGIGTILSNTLETKAYVSDEFSYTLTRDSVDNTKYNLNNSLSLNLQSFYSTDYFIVCNLSNNLGIWYFTFNGNTNFRLQQLSYISSNYNYNTLIVPINFSISGSVTFTYLNVTCSDSSASILNIDVLNSSQLTTSFYLDSYASQLQSQYDSLQVEYTSYQNTHAYTNEQYNNLMSQNATLTQQVHSLQSQYDTYVSLHSYTNTQYETLLNNYNNLQTMYNSLQQQYLDLQQRYNELNLLLSPFIDNIWTRSATLNGTTIDISSTSYHNNIISFNGTYLEIYPYDMDIYSSYIQGENDFQMIATSSSTITIGNYTAIAPLSHSLGDGFRIEFYLDSTIVYSSTWFDNDMTASDGSSSTDTFNSIVPITFNRFILNLQASTGTSGFTSYSYFKATTGSFNDGYNYAVEQLQPRINILEDSLEEAINKQQVRYSEGYNEGFEARIIHNLCME